MFAGEQDPNSAEDSKSEVLICICVCYTFVLTRVRVFVCGCVYAQLCAYAYVCMCDHTHTFALQSSVMDVLIEKIEMFASYIETAARTFTTPGHCLPVLRKLSPEKKQVSS